MKLIYTHPNRLLVEHARNVLENEGIATTTKNEYLSSGFGEISGIDSWPELWVDDPVQYKKGAELIENLIHPLNPSEWICNQCQEKNDGSFAFCWNCQNTCE